MNLAKTMRLVRRNEESRQEKFLREIRERLRRGERGNGPEYGMGEVDNTPLARTIDVKRVLENSVRKTDEE
jgi:hypothetical protein